MTYYISGPMTGIKDDNRRAFLDAGERLCAEGHTFVGPQYLQGAAYRTLLGIDLQYICVHGDGVYMLKGWEQSPGARAEHAVAVAINLPIRYEAS